MTILDDRAAKAIQEAMDARVRALSANHPTTHMAEVIEIDQDGITWVHVFGGADRTPAIRSLAKVKKGDLVTVTIEEGVVTINGSSSNPAASVEYVEAANYAVAEYAKQAIAGVLGDVLQVKNAIIEKATIEDLTAVNTTVQNLAAAYANINELVVGKADIADLTAATGRITNLESTSATIDQLNAEKARIDTIESDYITTDELEAEEARIGNLIAEKADIDDLTAATGRITNLESTRATITQLQAAEARISDIEADYITSTVLEADYIDADTIEATYMHANMSNSDVAWIQNGVIKDGSISSAMINDVSANKLTAGTINGSVINVTNLNADNITTGTINGQRIGEGSLSLDKLSEDVYTEGEVDAIVDGLNDRIDGAIETHTGTVVPTLNNSPASSWNTTALRDEHVGDVYYVVNSQSQQNGYCYRFTKSGSSYSWQLIKDSDVTAALSRLETAEGKITTFDSDISTLKTDTGTLATRTTNLETRADDVDEALLDKVDVTTFNEVSDTVDSHSQTISQHTTAISNKADNSTVTAVTNRVSKNEQDISGINTTIGELQTTVESKADGSTVETVSSRLNTVSDTVDGHTQSISSINSTLTTKADSSTVSTLSSTVNSVQQTANSNSSTISQLVTTLGTNADGTTKTGDVVQRMSSVEQDLSGFKTTVSNTYASKTSVEAAQADATNALNRQVAYSATCSTAAGTAAKVATCTQFPALAAGVTVTVRFSVANTSTGAVTLNVNSTGAKTIYVNGAATASGNQLLWSANANITFTYDGTYWRVVSEPRTWYGTCATAAATAAKAATINEIVVCKGTVVKLNMTYENTNTSATMNITSTGAKNLYYGTTSTRPTTANGYGWGASSTATFVFDGQYWRVGDTSVLSRLIQAETTISSHTTSINQNAESIALKADANDVYTKTQTDGLISTEVTNRNAAITAKANEITTSVAETYSRNVAGRNLLSGKAASVLEWTNVMPSYVTLAGEEYECLWTLVTGVSGWENVYSPAITVESGKVYTVSMDYSVESDYTPYGSGDQRMFGLEVCTSTASTSNNFATQLAKIPFGITAKERTRGSATFTATTDTIYLHLNGGYIKDGMENKSFITSRLMLEEGSAHTSYMPPLSDYATHTDVAAAKAEIKVTTDGISSEVSKMSSAKYVNSSTASWTLPNIKTYAAEGHSEGWNVASTDGLRVGDTVYVKGTDSTRNCTVYIKTTVTAISSSTRFVGTSHGYEDVLPVETIKSTINQSADSVKIQAKHVEIDGAAIFSNTAFRNAADAAYDAKGAAATVQANLDNLEIGGRNLLPCSQRTNAGSATAHGITLAYDGDGWFSVSGTRSGTAQAALSLWADSDYATPVNTLVPQEGGESICITVETEGTPFLEGSAYTDSTHIVFYGDASSKSIRLGGFNGLTYSGSPSYFISEIRYYIGVSCSGTVNGRFRIKMERGNVATDWTPAPEDMTTYVDESIDNINVGGRNLALNTSWDVASKTKSSTNAFVIYGANMLSETLQTGDTVTVSYWARSQSGAYNANPYVGYNNGSSNTGAHSSPTYKQIGTDWTFRSETFTLTHEADRAWITAASGGGSNYVFEVKGFKVERGNVATDWTPAPEDMASASTGVYYATCDTAGETAVKVATTEQSGFALVPGAMVNVKFTATNSAAVADLKLNIDGTGDKPIKYIYNTSLNNLPGVGYLLANNVYTFRYDGTNWVVQLMYNTDTQNRTRWQNVILAAAAMTSGHIICGTASGYRDIAASVTFDLSYPLLYCATTKAAGGTSDNNFLQINSIKVTNNGTVTSAANYKTVYLVGTVSGNTFTVKASPFMTTVEPTSEDGFFYIPLGAFYNSTTNIYFNSTKDLYAYIDSRFRQVTPTEIVATQRIYWRTATSGTPAKPDSWVTATANAYASWTTKVPPLSSDGTTGASKYPYLYTCEQRKRLDGTVECTAVLLDDTTTIIDGGNIITGTVSANAINAQSGTFNTANIPALTADHIKANVINAVNNGTGTINADKINVSAITIGQSQVTNLTTDLTAKASASDLTAEINQRKAQYGTCSTAVGTQAKAVTCANFELVAGNELTVKFSTANTYASGAVQLNVNSKGAKNVWVANAVTSTTNKLLWGAGAYITFRYDGTQFIVIGEPREWYGASTTAASTAAKTDTTAVTGCVICKGTKVSLAMTNENTAASPTLNIQSTGALAIYAGNSTTRPTAANGLSWASTYTQTFIFDGAYWRTGDSGSTARAKAQSDAAAKTATNYITATESDGIKVHNASNTTTYVQILNNAIDFVHNSASAMKLWLDNSVAKIRVGLEAAGHAIFSATGMDIYTDATSKVASIGETTTIGADGNLQLKMAPGALSLENELDETVYSVVANASTLIQKTVVFATLSTPDTTARTISDPYIVDLQYVGAEIWPLGDEYFTSNQYTATVTAGSGVTIALTQAGVDQINEWLDGETYEINLYATYRISNTEKATLEMDGAMSIDGQGRIVNVTNSSWSTTNKTGIFVVANNSIADRTVGFGVGDGGKNAGIWDYTNNKWMIYTDGSKNTYVGGSKNTYIRGENFEVNPAGNLWLISDKNSAIYQQCTNRSLRLGAAAPSATVYFANHIVKDSNNDTVYYSELAYSAAKDLYRSFVVRRYDSSGSTYYTNGFYLHVDNNGDPSVSFTSGGAAAWRSGLGIGAIGLKSSLAASDIPSLAASKITSGTFDLARLQNVAWTYSTGSASAAFYVRWCKVAHIVHVEVYGSKSISTDTSTTLSTTAISSGNRPSKEVDSFLYSAQDHIGALWVSTGGAVQCRIKGASATTVYGSLSYPAGVS